MKFKMMIAKIIIIMMTGIIYSQTIPVEDFYKIYENEESIPFTKIKDVNNKFTPFLGNWVTTWQGKDYTFKIAMKTIFTTNGNEIDEMYVEHNIKDTNGAFIEKHICEPTEVCRSDGKMKYGYLRPNNIYRLFYSGIDYRDKCNTQGFIYLWFNNTNYNELHYDFKKEWLNDPGCNAAYDSNMPSEAVIFQKVD